MPADFTECHHADAAAGELPFYLRASTALQVRAVSICRTRLAGFSIKACHPLCRFYLQARSIPGWSADFLTA